MRIFHWFNLAIIAAIVAVVSVISVVSITTMQRDLVQEMIDQATTYSKTVALGINSASFLQRRDLLAQYLDRMIPESRGWMCYAAVTNLENYAWIHTQRKWEYATLSNDVSRRAIENVSTTNPYLQIYDDGVEGKTLDVASLILVDLKERGVLRFGFSFANVKAKVHAAVLRAIIIGLASIIAGILLSTVLAKLVTRPISRIAGQSKAVAAGKLSVTFSDGSRIVELGELAQSIEEMKRDLKYIYIGGVFADLHHAIKSDLGLIAANVEYVQRYAGNPSQTQELTRKMREIADRVDAINAEINKYRAYQRPRDVKTVPVDINRLVEEATTALACPSHIRLDRCLRQGMATVLADPSHLKKALGNIMTNALEAMPDGGTIAIETAQEGGGVKIRIADTGIGIAAGDIAKVFEPHYSTKLRHGGEGIGLAVAKILIEDVHGGTIDVRSSPGQGTEFSVWLPQAI